MYPFFEIFYQVFLLSTPPSDPSLLKRPGSRYPVCLTESRESLPILNDKLSPILK